MALRAINTSRSCQGPHGGHNFGARTARLDKVLNKEGSQIDKPTVSIQHSTPLQLISKRAHHLLDCEGAHALFPLVGARGTLIAVSFDA
mmetsp:Transcript_50008/g.115402  ORF Transcript_50008/g.115402 Transcript_50008/m.115402 type:complete len:89 (-) Transcript_50008:143-409(-)